MCDLPGLPRRIPRTLCSAQIPGSPWDGRGCQSYSHPVNHRLPWVWNSLPIIDTQLNHFTLLKHYTHFYFIISLQTLNLSNPYLFHYYYACNKFILVHPVFLTFRMLVFLTFRMLTLLTFLQSRLHCSLFCHLPVVHVN